MSHDNPAKESEFPNLGPKRDVCTCGYGLTYEGREKTTCLGNRLDCKVKKPCAGGDWIVGDGGGENVALGKAAHGVCSVCGKEPREHEDKT